MKKLFTLFICVTALTFPAIKAQTITDADGNVYNTITIGTQLWMKENLKTTKYRDGSSIPNVTDNSTWANLTTGAYCEYANIPSNADIWGRLYNGHTVADTRGLCPTGWHVPTEDDWAMFENYLTSNGFNYDGTFSPPYKLAKALATNTLWLTSTVTGSPGNSDYPAMQNITGFTALPSGWRFGTGLFNGQNHIISWWSSTFAGSVTSSRGISHDDNLLNPYTYGKGVGLSVRCICDLPVNLNETENSNEIKLYPNPTTDFVVVEGLKNNSYIEIINLQGQTVKNIKVSSSKTSIDILELPEGVYIIRIKSDETTSVTKLIKQ
ncbi:MAG: T9SS type A sorting domain-containing protein [Flavobacteriales bacterium]|nr:MAG: T9SS type A sorting domain-containing protein [Flavobacteriales bacterium]